MIDAKEADSHLIGQDAALVLVVAGCFSVSQRNEEGKEQELHLCYAGKIIKGGEIRRLLDTNKKSAERYRHHR